MILNQTKPNIELSADFEMKSFGIGDVGMMFEILRSKMYSNPIQTICREYISNAVDSHREAGCPEQARGSERRSCGQTLLNAPLPKIVRF